MMMLLRPGQAVEAESGEAMVEMTFIVAREGSELAATLRARGWTARSGWRSTHEHGRNVWHVRFQRPDDPPHA